ncbi:hypothetical protein HMPREF1550_01987 [Actinomyces sp. oral taxon 877 str. F0543]|nr:hypothetical protein HMPREF1550_01987 [Actinomyces sp. oral taxon 877 str. F0543]
MPGPRTRGRAPGARITTRRSSWPHQNRSPSSTAPSDSFDKRLPPPGWCRPSCSSCPSCAS